MADIAKCEGRNISTGVDCDKRDKCYRYTAPSSFLQSYIDDGPFLVTRDGTQDCDYYWPINGRRIKDD